MTTIHWNAAGNQGRTEAGHRIAVLGRQGVRIRVVQVLNPPGARVLELTQAVEAGADPRAIAQTLIDAPPAL